MFRHPSSGASLPRPEPNTAVVHGRHRQQAAAQVAQVADLSELTQPQHSDSAWQEVASGLEAQVTLANRPCQEGKEPDRKSTVGSHDIAQNETTHSHRARTHTSRAPRGAGGPTLVGAGPGRGECGPGNGRWRGSSGRSGTDGSDLGAPRKGDPQVSIVVPLILPELTPGSAKGKSDLFFREVGQETGWDSVAKVRVRHWDSRG